MDDAILIRVWRITHAEDCFPKPSLKISVLPIVSVCDSFYHTLYELCKKADIELLSLLLIPNYSKPPICPLPTMLIYIITRVIGKPFKAPHSLSRSPPSWLLFRAAYSASLSNVLHLQPLRDTAAFLVSKRSATSDPNNQRPRWFWKFVLVVDELVGFLEFWWQNLNFRLHPTGSMFLLGLSACSSLNWPSSLQMCSIACIIGFLCGV